MSREFQDSAVATMLCLKLLGLNRDVAFTVVQRTIEMKPRCVLVASDVDLSSEQKLRGAACAVVDALWDDEARVFESSYFEAYTETLRLSRSVGPE
jgi:hypothetical protein